MHHVQVLRVKTKVKDGVIRPDIEIIQGIDYCYPGLQHGDTEVEVTCNAIDDGSLTNKPVTVADFAIHMTKLRSNASFIRLEPIAKAKKSSYSNKL